MTWLRIALALVAVVALSAGIAGWDKGWAFADQSLTPPGAEKFAPAMVIELNLGWWNSTTHVESGWVPGAIETSGKASRALGVITIVAVACGALSALYFLLLAVCNVFGMALPTKLRASPATKYKAAGLFGMISLVLTIVLYLGLMFGAHNEIKKHYGDDASVWARPDWASGCAFLGSVSLLALAYQLAPEGYEPVGYMPI